MADREAAFMARALEEARRGLGLTRPNPAVGAVLVRGGRIVGAGHHRVAGGPHAEVEALARAGRRARGATLYVTLEPCDHHGRTGPCTERLLEAGVARVVVGCRDPNPLVDGKGVSRLRDAGVEVRVGVREPECRALIDGYARHIQTGLPLVILKAATSLDGRLATRSGESAGLTGAAAHAHLHQLRARCDAIMVGVGTVLADDPRLTVRGTARRPDHDLVRVVVDSRGRTPSSARVISGGGTCVVACTDAAPAARLRRLEAAGAEIEVCRAQRDRVSLRDLLRRLGGRGLTTLLVEGGGQIHGSLLRQGLADRAAVYIAPRLIGGDGVPLAAGPGRARLAATMLREPHWQELCDDMLLTGSFR